MIRLEPSRLRRALYLISLQMGKEARGLHKSVILAIWSISEYKVTLPSQRFCFAPSAVSPENKLTPGSVRCCFAAAGSGSAEVRQVKRAKLWTMGLSLPAMDWFLVQAVHWEPFRNALKLTRSAFYFGGGLVFSLFRSVLGFFAFRIKIRSLHTSCCFQSSRELSTVYWRMWQYKPHKMQLL